MMRRNIMSDPIQLLYMGTEVPDLSTSSFGPFVVHAVADRDELAQALDLQRYDATLLCLGDAREVAQLPAWPQLPRVVLDSALLVVAPEPEAAEVLRLLRLGVQEVLPRREATPDALARCIRAAVERQRLAVAARKAYATDLATGLPNHGQLMEHMTHLLALREREPAAMALLVLRIDGLAATESRLGAESANVLRRKVAVRLRAGLRASDVVASVGLDTFAVLLAWMDAPADAARVATKLAQALQRPFSVAGQDVAVAASVGLAQYPEHGKAAEQLLGRALAQAGESPAVGRAGLSARGGAAAANDE